MDDFVRAAKELVESISFDDNGALIGGRWMGGHGGLLSDETRKKADVVRTMIHHIEAQEGGGVVENPII
jgi:hypothetical protein